MKTLLILLLTLLSAPLWATTITCRDTLEIVMDSQAIGRFEDAVKNHSSLATDIKNAVKAVVETKALNADTVKDAVRDEARTAAAGITLSIEAQAAIEAAR